MSPRPHAIIGTIRKDLQLLWPLALTIVVLQFVTTAFFHEVTELIGAHLPADRALLGPKDVLYWLGAIVPPLLAAVFIFLAVQTDVATDTRYDWLTRPVGALEIVVAKIVLVLGVVLVPYVLGNVVFMLMWGVDPSVLWPPIVLVLRNCLTGIMLAWLVSSLLQAVLAMVGLAVTSGLVFAFVTAVLAALYYSARAHAGLPPGPPPEFARGGPAPLNLLVQLAMQAAEMSPVLWLLLVRRRKGPARLVFALVYLASSAYPLTQMTMTEPKKAAASAQSVIKAPHRETTHE
jgi:hypothetical protein